jgi:hypothetical protein
MLHAAPSNKPIISHYPPSAGFDFEGEKDLAAPRICGADFVTEGEGNIIKLGNNVSSPSIIVASLMTQLALPSLLGLRWEKM